MPLPDLHLLAGLSLVAAAWALPRYVAGSRGTSAPALALDIAPLALGAAWLAVTAGRPIFAGLVTLVLAAGFAVADCTTRRVLGEPIVFSTISELPQVFLYPHLYLPFAGAGMVIGGAAVGAGLVAVVLACEPPAFPPRPLLAGIGAVAVGTALRLCIRPSWLAGTARMCRRLHPSGEPEADAARLGPLAMQVVYATLARAERGQRRRGLAVPPGPTILSRSNRLPGPLVLVQCESFFDARRLSPDIPPDLLPGFDRCRAEGQHGRLAVPGWGANTMRTEFAVLTGAGEQALGYDRFNPYYALARAPMASQVWRLREAGYRTICLHPFERRFFRRDLVLPGLGFEDFLGSETLGGSRIPPYLPDPELAGRVLRVVEEAGPHSFIFVITMGNHGPWPGDALSSYLEGLRGSDAMLGILADALAARWPDAVLSLYGDHLPSLSPVFARCRFTETTTDYVVWPAPRDAGMRLDLPAHRLGAALVERVLGPHPD